MASGVFSAGAARLAGKTVLVVSLSSDSLSLSPTWIASLMTPAAQPSRSPSTDWCLRWNRSCNRELPLMVSIAAPEKDDAAAPSAHRMVRVRLALRS